MKKLIYLLAANVLFSCVPKKKNSEVTVGKKPNIVMILVDDLGKEWVNAYGAEEATTPNIDALAKSGTLFNNVYSMPQCTPTRVTFLTGQYPFRHGWVNHWDVPRWGGGAHFDETLNPSIGVAMKEAGYKTCIAGKWQIDDFRVEPDALTRAGFDEFCMWTGYETGIEASAERYQDPYLFTKEGSKTYSGKFGPDLFKNFIINFIKDNKDQPMFVYYPMVLTHTPFVNTPLDSSSTNLGKHKAMLKYTDLITGEIMEAIDQAGIRDNTLVIFTTDNGTSKHITGTRNGHKIIGRKGFTEEPGICEPFIASWPKKVASNTTSNALIDFTDFYPTFLDLAGIEPKNEIQVGNTKYKIDGHSFKEVLLRGGNHSERKWILGMGGGNFAKLTEKGVENQYRFRDRVIRNKRYKLWINSKRQPKKFFDLKEDPLEKYNLMDSLGIGDRKNNYEQLLEAVKTFPKVDNDPKYIPNPPQEWDVEITAESEKWKQ